MVRKQVVLNLDRDIAEDIDWILNERQHWETVRRGSAARRVPRTEVLRDIIAAGLPVVAAQERGENRTPASDGGS